MYCMLQNVYINKKKIMLLTDQFTVTSMLMTHVLLVYFLSVP